jgi:glutamate dehydrogenase
LVIVRIDEKYLDISTNERAFRLESYRSSGTVSSAFQTQLRCYFVTQCEFVVKNPNAEEAMDITKVADKTFIEKVATSTLELFERIMQSVLERTGPVIELHESESTRCKRLVIGYRQGSTQSFFSAMSDLYHYYELYSARKYVENFSNGVTIMSFYLLPIRDSKSLPIEHTILQIMKEASLIYCLPSTPLQYFFQTGTLSGKHLELCLPNSL